MPTCTRRTARLQRQVPIALRRVPPCRPDQAQPVDPMGLSFYRPQASPTVPTGEQYVVPVVNDMFLSPSGESHRADFHHVHRGLTLTVFLSPSGESHRADERENMPSYKHAKQFLSPSGESHRADGSWNDFIEDMKKFLSPSGESHRADGSTSTPSHYYVKFSIALRRVPPCRLNWPVQAQPFA